MWGLALQPSVRPQSMEFLASRLEKTFAAEKGEVHESGMQCITVQNRTIQGSKAQNSIMENSMMERNTVQKPAVQDRMTNEAKTNIQVKRLLPVIAAAAGVLIVLVIAILCLL